MAELCRRRHSGITCSRAAGTGIARKSLLAIGGRRIRDRPVTGSEVRCVMRKLLLASASLLALGVVSASAADLPARMPAKAPAYVPPMAFSWTGFYLGLNGGYGFGRGEFTGGLPSGGFDAGGGLFGATIGYNWQTGPLVFGLEGDIDWSGMKGSGTCGVATACDVRSDYLSTIRGRLGYAIDRWMPYITGGAAI